MLKKVNVIDIRRLVTKTDYDPKINEIKGELLSTVGVAISAALNSVDNKITNVNNLLKKKI